MTQSNKPKKATRAPDGSQSISRAVDLLRAVAEEAPGGARLFSVADKTGLHIATARRILQALVAEGLLGFESNTKKYFIGPTVFSFAVKGSPWFSRSEAFMPALEEIARRTRDTALFSIRSGIDSVCLARREGDFPIRVMSLNVGSIRPLGVGSGSLAILAFLQEEERRTILNQNSKRFKPFGISAADVSEMIADTRKVGFSFNSGRIIENVYGVGVPILTGEDDGAVASVSVAAPANRMDAKRRAEIVAVIAEALRTIPGVFLPKQLSTQTKRNIQRAS